MKTILVVEDDPPLSRVYRDKLTSAGFDVQAAHDGEAAIAALKKSKPDLIILDLLLPKKDGFQVLQEIHDTAGWKSIPVVVASNLGVEDDIAKAKKLGAKDYIVKSDTSLADLISKVKRMLE